MKLLQVVAGLVKGYKEDKVHSGVFGADMQVHLEARKALLFLKSPGGADQRRSSDPGAGVATLHQQQNKN